MAKDVSGAHKSSRPGAPSLEESQKTGAADVVFAPLTRCHTVKVASRHVIDQLAQRGLRLVCSHTAGALDSLVAFAG